MQNQDITYKNIYSKLAKRTENYAKVVRDVFLNRMGEIAKLCEGVTIPEGEVFHFNDYPEIAGKVQEQLRTMYSEMYQNIRGDITREWVYANDNMDRLVKAMFGKEAAEQPHFAKYFQRNKEAMDSFFARKTDGLDLSQRIWKYVGEGKEELELALDLGLGAGKDADELSRDVRKYLRDTDKLFRRVRNKHGELVLSKAAKAYHPGRGKYRSSYKNAMRLTRTETNMAYRAADITRWQRLPFILGYEVKLSHNHSEKMPHGDICDTLKGKYPVGFMFKGWHPHCFCYIVPLLCTDKELEELTGRILDGTEDEFTPQGVIKDVPDNFKGWLADNSDRLDAASSMPYFIRDNFPKGDYTKEGNWLPKIHNEAGAGNVAQMLAENEIDIDAYNKVQAMTQKEWEESSNYLPEDSKEADALLKATDISDINEIAYLSDADFANMIKQSECGLDILGKWIDKDSLAQLEHVAKAAKFASKNEGRFVMPMPKTYLEAQIKDGKAHFDEILKMGTNYSNVAKDAIGYKGEKAIVVVKTPAGSRYVQSMDGKMQQAVFLPGTQYKVAGKTEKVIKSGDKATKITQYELELVDDGSSHIEKLVQTNAEAQKMLAKYNKTKHGAENVVKAAKKGHYDILGIDTHELEDMLENGMSTADEIKDKAKELAKAMSAAKKKAVEEAKDAPNYWVLLQEFGEADAMGFMANWKKHMDKWGESWVQNDYLHSPEQVFLEKVIKKELKYAKMNPNKYPTTPKFIEYFEKLQVQWESKIEIKDLQSDIDAVINFASTCKPNAKIHTMVNDLLLLQNSKTPDLDALKKQLAIAKKEKERLEKEKIKLLLKKTGGTGYDIGLLYSEEDKAMINELRAEYEKRLLAAKGNERDFDVCMAMSRLATATSELGEKYLGMQPALKNVDGFTENEIKKMIKEWVGMTPTNPTVDKGGYSDWCWGTGHGGVNWFGGKSACTELAKKIKQKGGNVTAEELATIREFTQSSNFICDYLYGTSFIDKAIDSNAALKGQKVLELFKTTINKAIESMPRYNGVTYRGLNIYPSALKDPKQDGFWNSIMEAWNSKDKVWTMVAPTSTTTSISTADSFANGIVHASKGQRVIMKIYGKTGVDIHEIGYFGGGESEITFRAGSKFRLIKAPYKCTKPGLGRKGDWCVEIEEILD